MKLKSSEPFWLVKNGLLHTYPSLRTDLKTDILIVGGGITGSLIAHQCMADGYATTLVDRREVAHGSTSATTSMLQYEIDVPLYQLTEQIGAQNAVAAYRGCAAAIDELAGIVREVKSDCGFRKKESLYFAAYKKDQAGLLRELEARKKNGFDVSWLTQAQIRSRYGLHHAFGGILSAQGGSMDAFILAHDLLAYNHERGLQVFDKTEVKAGRYGKKEVQVRTEYGNIITAKKVIYCNGFESTEMIKGAFVSLQSTYALVGEPEDGALSALEDTLFWNTADPYHYMRTTDDGRLLIGGADEEFAQAARRDAAIGKKVAVLERYAQKVLPHYALRPDFAWAGTFGSTKDGLPYIGMHPKFPGAYFVLGFGGNGITFSVLGMGIISDMLQGKISPLADIFKFGR